MASIGSLTADLRLESAAFIRNLNKAAQETARNTNAMRRHMASLQASARNVSRGFTQLRSVIGAYVGIRTVQNFVQTADAAAKLQGQLRLVIREGENLADTQQRLFDLSQNTYSSFEATVQLYTRFARSTQQLNLSQDQLLRITETVNKAMVVSGASAEEAQRAIVQLSQGMAAGVLRGQDFNSVMSMAPRLAQALSDALGVSLGELRNMAAKGKLTAETVSQALVSQSQVIDREFQQMPRTVGQALTQLQNQWMMTVSGASEAAGATQGLVGAIDKLRGAIASQQFVAGLTAAAKGLAAIAANLELVILAAGTLAGMKLGRIVGGQLGAVVGAVIGGTEAWKLYKDAIEAANKATEEAASAAKGLVDGGGPAKPGLPPPPPGGGGISDSAKMLENLRFEYEQLQRTNVEREIYNNLRHAGVDLTSREGQQIATLTSAIEDYRNVQELLIADQDVFANQMATLDRLLQQGEISWEEYRRAVEKAAKAQSEQFRDSLQNAVGYLQSFTGALAGESKVWFRISQGLAVVQTLISAHEGATKALAQLGAFGWPMYAAIMAAGIANAAFIAAQRPEGGGSRGGGAGAGGGGGGMPNLSSTMNSITPVSQQQAEPPRIELTVTVDPFSGESYVKVARGLMEFQRSGGEIVLKGKR